MRSRTGCLTCRTRKLKCDEQRPVCAQCRKGGRECRPSEGIVFRHQQNASMNDGEQQPPEGRGELKGFYSYKNTFNKDSVWLDIPKHVIFVDNSDPYAEDLEIAESSAIALAQARNQRWGSTSKSSDTDSHGLEALSAVASHDRFAYSPMAQSTPETISYPSPNRSRSSMMPPPASPSVSISAASNNTNINFLLNPSNSISPPLDSALAPDQRNASLPSRPAILSRSSVEHRSDGHAETDFEAAFLLRHYTEGPGLWMDLYDLGTYFASCVPVRARINPLLKYAACAYAAKQLGRVSGAKAKMGGVCSRQAAMEVWPDKDRDFAWVGAKYYEKAIQLLMRELQPDAGAPPPLSTPEAFGQWQANELAQDAGNPRKRRRRVSNSRLSRGVHSDEILAATAILSVYEFLDATGPAWNRHLSGVKTLLDVAEVGIMPLEHLSPEAENPYQYRKSRLSRARKAAFWNFARQDYLAAFINECQTRLNTDDILMWTEAGLLLDPMGFVVPSNTGEAGYPEGSDVMKEDQICNALVWIMSKIVNHIGSNENLNGNDKRPVDSSPLGVPQQATFERWYRLEAELDAWFNGLPDTFKPCARIEPSRITQFGSSDDYKDLATLQEIWHSIPMCASSMQHYHMARILMLINKPHESTGRRNTITLRLQSYRSIETEIGFHSREILGIGLARPDGAVRINSLQPLFVAGQCLTDPRERRTAIRLLRAIESDLGWATEYRVQQLLKEWGWEGSPLHSATGT
ncbi:Fungal Zn(2)-Cys(6) binuclear cluster domain-containing protein [Penicillium ucsense]|uniref:Fungal Zn(2)-Cys(6) binuclear cluster domain-containing protein n=1 Tax=Penicillium ucsense TaxID=2839758 RepID=A0A8J8VYK4_9EURO|nr:Fungal Zn(2)-Cys(6) binuclear cluster domain-containing protein [Penicillium ucsense]KAF7733714.1 Fungal Zn(2)-Cys(6) binuclear cluster domain-containing protein [Penicillium ucsense]